MNNTKHFNHTYMLPIKQLTPSVYISDGQGRRLDILIPTKGGVSASESSLVEKIIKQNGRGSLPALMKTIAEKTAKQNGGDPIKVLTPLINYSRGNFDKDPLSEYRPYFFTYCEADFDQFSKATETNILRKWDMAGCMHALLSRVAVSDKFNPAKWKTEMALDGEILPFSVLKQAEHLYDLESQGYDLTPYINTESEFTYVADSVLSDRKKEKEEKAEVVAGK
jgi:hypothetical protein